MKTYFLITAAIWACTSCNAPGKEQETAGTQEADLADTPVVMRQVSFDPQQIRNVGIEIGKPVLRDVSGTLTLQGKIDVPPQSTVSLSFPLGGYLKSTKMLPGMQVR